MSDIALVPLRDLLAESQNGISKRRGDSGSQVAVLRLADISRGTIDESDPREIQLTEKEVEKYALRQGDLVCIRVNGSKNLVGRVVPFRSSGTWAYCDHFIRLRPRHDIVDFRYLAHFFETGHVRRYVELNMVSSAGQNTVSQGTMLDLAVPLPALTVQRKIVAELEKQFSRLDEAVANLLRVKANLKRYKASVLKDAVEGRLVPTEAELARRDGRSFETGEQLLQRILEMRRSQWKGKGKFKAAVSPEIAELHELPDGWTWCATDQVCEKITDGEHISPSIVSDGIPLLSAKDVLDAGVTFDDAKYVTASDAEKFRSRCDPDLGDILIVSRGATIGRACRVNTDRVFSLMGSVILMKPTKLVDASYLMLALKAGFFLTRLTAVSGSTAQQAIYIRDVRPLQLPLPPFAEQKRISAEVDRLLSIVRSVEVEVDANLKRAQALRQAVLARAFASSSH